MRRLLIALCLTLSVVAPALGQTLRIGLREDPDLLDPTLGSSYVGRIVFAGLCDKLFDITPDLHIVPQLATGYDYKDPTHLILHMRPNVMFQDGEPVDAEAVRYTLMRELNAKGSMRRGEVNSISAITVIDPLTVELELKQPSSPLIAQFTDRAGMILPPKVVEQEQEKFGLKPVCSGPFRFVQRVQQDRIELERFPGYWNSAAIHLEKVIYLPQPNAAVRLANLQAGALDLVEQILPSDVPAVQRDPKLKLAVDDSLAYEGITFNTGNGPDADTVVGKSALVRRAFELAIDRTALISVVYNGMFTPTAQANPPSSPFYDPTLVPPKRDVAAAKALLKQAGVTLPVPVTLTIQNNSDIQQAGQVIQAMANEAGFDVKLQTMEFASSLQAGYAGHFQAYLIGWSGRSDPDGNMWQFLHATGTFNYGHYDNPDVNKWLDDARLVTDIATRNADYHKVWMQERADMPLVYLWVPKNIVGMRKEVEGFTQVPDGIIRLQGVRLETK